MRLLSLSRNFGKEIALTAGIGATSGEAVVLIDAEQKAGLPHLRGHLYRMAGTAKGAIADNGAAL